MSQAIGVIVIGRNEGGRLCRSLESLPVGLAAIVYVDSGSSDHSVDEARAMGALVHELAPNRRFSAARARSEGFDTLVSLHPGVEFVQFLDGDCTLEQGWLATAAAALKADHRLGVICGLVEEESPGGSIYNRMNAIRWRFAAIGEIAASGGVFMVRRRAYEASGGFSQQLVTGEEAELCERIRTAGYRIERIGSPMARHESGLLSFRDWWKRAVWGGYGDALLYDVTGGRVSRARRRETRSVVLLVICLPCLFAAGFALSIWWPILRLLPPGCVLAYTTVLLKIGLDRCCQGDTWTDAGLYAVLCMVRKVPYSVGFLGYRLLRGSRWMRPDPHADGQPA